MIAQEHTEHLFYADSSEQRLLEGKTIEYQVGEYGEVMKWDSELNLFKNHSGSVTSKDAPQFDEPIVFYYWTMEGVGVFQDSLAVTTIYHAQDYRSRSSYLYRVTKDRDGFKSWSYKGQKQGYEDKAHGDGEYPHSDNHTEHFDNLNYSTDDLWLSMVDAGIY